MRRPLRVADRSTGRRRGVAAGLVVALFVVAAASVAMAQRGSRFGDVSADDPDRAAIEWAAEVGLTVGFGDGRFGPDETMTRYQALTFMERFFDLGLADNFTRGEMMTLLHAINRDLPLLNRTRCANSNATDNIGPFLLLEGHHSIEMWITELDGTHYGDTLVVHIQGRDRVRLFPYDSFADSRRASSRGEWFTVHKVRESEWATMEVLTGKPAKWTLCVTARRLERIGL